MTNDGILVVAFDGMDKKLIDKYQLDYITQRYIGSIDNDSGIKSRSTSELFASMITGETWEKHGVTGVMGEFFGSEILGFFESLIKKTYLGTKTRGLRKAIYTSFQSIDYERRKYRKKDYDLDTIFDEIGGKALYVPSYNPDPDWMLGKPHQLIKYYEIEKVLDENHRNTQKRLKRFSEINHSFWKLTFLHLHEPDTAQDLHYENLEKEYERLDKIAKEIKEEYGEQYEYIIFMSDHGRPIDSEHNKKAFYSSNKRLSFGSEPHITEFYGEILRIIR